MNEEKDTVYGVHGSTLTNIADAIRDKTGETDLMKVADMAENIEGIVIPPVYDPCDEMDVSALDTEDTYNINGSTIEGIGQAVLTKTGEEDMGVDELADAIEGIPTPPEEYVFEEGRTSIDIPTQGGYGNTNFDLFGQYDSFNNLITLGEKIILKGEISYNGFQIRFGQLFHNSKHLVDLSNVILTNKQYTGRISSDRRVSVYFPNNNPFYNCENLTKLPKIEWKPFVDREGNIHKVSRYTFNTYFRLSGLFSLPQEEYERFIFSLFVNSGQYNSGNEQLIDGIHCYKIQNCYLLTQYYIFYGGNGGNSMDKNNTDMILGCPNISSIIFRPYDATATTMSPMGNTIYDFTSAGIGYTRYDIPGLDVPTREQDSLYNHDSAVETLNSLPTAVWDTTGKTATIKFKSNQGSATSAGGIGTLTSEEIAVATDKGWTITLV